LAREKRRILQQQRSRGSKAGISCITGQLGFRSDLLMHRLKGYGIAIMTNSDSGGQIIEEIEARVAAAAEWDTLDKPVLR
jgi:hypothetical protein